MLLRRLLNRTCTCFAAAALVASCDSSSGPDAPRAPAALRMVSGNDQEGVVGQQLANPIVVEVTDRNGRPVVGQTVTFQVTAGGGSVVESFVLTDARGLAQSRWTLGTVSDSQRVEVRVVDVTTAQTLFSTRFSAFAQAGAPWTMTLLSPEQQQADLGATLPESLSVRITDQYGNGVRGITVTWTISSQSGTASPTSSQTNADGIAKAAWTLGSRLDVQHSATASAGPLTATTRAFARLRYGTPVTRVSGDGQTDTVSAYLRDSLVLEVRLPDGRPVEGAEVRWSADSDGSVSPTSGVTNASGRASTKWRLGPSLGTQRVVAIVGNLGVGELAPVTFTATATAAIYPFSLLKLSGGGRHACALTTASDLYCWGENAFGQFGDGSTVSRTTPVRSGTGFTFDRLAGGYQGMCALTSAGTAYCWGDNWSGQVGDGTNVMRLTPTRVSGGLTFASITEGFSSHICGVSVGGAAYCWGFNEEGQLGDSTTTSRSTPVPVRGGLAFDIIASGGNFTCGLSADSLAYCWGRNDQGELGVGDTTDRWIPTLVAGGRKFTDIVSDVGDTCALTADGTAYCWGFNFWGGAGNGSRTLALVTTPVVGGLRFRSVARGNGHTCAIATDGMTYCWGYNGYGQLGIGGSPSLQDYSTSPRAVAGAHSFASITAGSTFTCGRRTDGVALCWGQNHKGQVGDGTTIDRSAPVYVRSP